MVVTVKAAGPAAETLQPIHATVKDNRDGTYTATYTVPSRGNYEVGKHSGPRMDHLVSAMPVRIHMQHEDKIIRP